MCPTRHFGDMACYGLYGSTEEPRRLLPSLLGSRGRSSFHCLSATRHKGHVLARITPEMESRLLRFMCGIDIVTQTPRGKGTPDFLRKHGAMGALQSTRIHNSHRACTIMLTTPIACGISMPIQSCIQSEENPWRSMTLTYLICTGRYYFGGAQNPSALREGQTEPH